MSKLGSIIQHLKDKKVDGYDPFDQVKNKFLEIERQEKIIRLLIDTRVKNYHKKIIEELKSDLGRVENLRWYIVFYGNEFREYEEPNDIKETVQTILTELETTTGREKKYKMEELRELLEENETNNTRRNE